MATKKTDDCLRNLLALIHRDGGHYAAEHGIAKASKDAEAIVVKLLAGETLQPASEPTEEEERKEFDKWVLSEWSERESIEREHGMSYKFHAINYAWQGWKARSNARS